MVKVPGLIEDLPDLLGMPVKILDGKVITFGDIATVQRTFKDATSMARVDGKPAVVLEVSSGRVPILSNHRDGQGSGRNGGATLALGNSRSATSTMRSIQVRDMLRDLL